MAISIDVQPRSFGRRVRDLPVGKKLFSGFLSLTLVLGLVVACLFFTVDTLGHANHDVVGVAAKRSELSDHLRFAAADLRGAQQAYVLGGAQSRQEFDEAASRFEATLDEVRATVDDTVESTLVRKIATGYQTFLSTDQLIWNAMQQGKPELATNLVLGAESLAFGFLAEDAEKLAVRADEDRKAAVAKFDQTSHDARNLGIALSAVALLVMTLASLVITRLIRDPLHRVQSAAERAAEGDLSASADVDSDDETGRLARAFNTMLAKLRQREELLLGDHRRQELQTQIYKALEMADDEHAALEVVGRTLGAVLPDRPSELLLADNSKANLEQAVVSGPVSDGPGCPVNSPFSCVAVRGGAPVTFESSRAIDACPHLRDRGGDPCSAVCVPVTFMGRAMGVLHTTGAEHEAMPAAEVDALSSLAAQSGARLGMLRTMARTSLQASTDALTGLMNRRTFQSRIRAMRRGGVKFSLVMADLDHFKRLNDTHGHEMGDRALTTFCAVAEAVLRQGDLMARWGGEEFAFALVGVSPQAAAEVLDRVRLELSARLSTSDIPGFTASFGVVAAGECDSLDDAVRRADDALYAAKAAGRNRVWVSGADAAVEVEVHPHHRADRADRPVLQPQGVLATLALDDDPLD